MLRRRPACSTFSLRKIIGLPLPSHTTRLHDARRVFRRRGPPFVGGLPFRRGGPAAESPELRALFGVAPPSSIQSSIQSSLACVHTCALPALVASALGLRGLCRLFPCRVRKHGQKGKLSVHHAALLEHPAASLRWSASLFGDIFPSRFGLRSRFLRTGASAAVRDTLSLPTPP